MVVKLAVKRIADFDPEAWEGNHVKASDYDQTVDEDCDIIDADTGAAVCTIRRGVISSPVARRVWEELRHRVKSIPDNRRMAAGKGSAMRLSSGGKTNAVSRYASTPSGIFKDATNEILGFFDGESRRVPYCRQTAFSAQHPEVWKATVPFCRELDGLYKELMPDAWGRQRAYADKIHPAYIIPDTVFSTVTVNRNWQVAYHTDAGDFHDGFGVMALWRAGKFTGGDLVFPGYRVAVHYGTTDICLANVHEQHGVSRIVGVKGEWERLVGVFYLREALIRCPPPEEVVRNLHKTGKGSVTK